MPERITMKIFIWEYVEELTDQYHSDGGLVIIAQDEERARQLAAERDVKFRDDEVPVSYDITAEKEKVYIFPDNGCCS